MNKEDLERIKNDLKELKKTVHLIDTLIKTRNNYLYRIKQLETSNRIKSKNEARELLDLALKIDTEGQVKKARELYEKYMDVINALGVTDKTIIIDYYLNGMPAYKVGLKIGYSEDGIRKRLSKILFKIATEQTKNSH